MKRLAAAIPAALASALLCVPVSALAGAGNPGQSPLAGFQDKCASLEDSLLVVERLYVDRMDGNEAESDKVPLPCNGAERKR